MMHLIPIFAKFTKIHNVPINEVYSGHFLKSLIWCTTQFPLKIGGARRCSGRVLIPAQSPAPVVLLLNENTIKIRVVYRFVQHKQLTPPYSTFPKFFFGNGGIPGISFVLLVGKQKLLCFS